MSLWSREERGRRSSAIAASTTGVTNQSFLRCDVRPRDCSNAAHSISGFRFVPYRPDRAVERDVEHPNNSGCHLPPPASLRRECCHQIAAAAFRMQVGSRRPAWLDQRDGSPGISTSASFMFSSVEQRRSMSTSADVSTRNTGHPSSEGHRRFALPE